MPDGRRRRYSPDVSLRALVQFPAAALATLVSWVMIFLLSARGRPLAAYEWVRWWARVLEAVTGVRHEVVGIENIPQASACVVISNHCSHVDGPLLILALPAPIYFVIKQELTRIPVWGATALRVGFIAVDRSDSMRSRRQLESAAEAVRGGRWVAVFAEGTRSRNGELLPFKKGGFRLAVDAQVPILPVAVNRSRRLMPKGALAARPGTVEIVIGQAIPTAGLSRGSVPELAARTRRAIADMRRRDPDFVDEGPG